jgi:hypothetical protein
MVPVTRESTDGDRTNHEERRGGRRTDPERPVGVREAEHDQQCGTQRERCRHDDHQDGDHDAHRCSSGRIGVPGSSSTPDDQLVGTVRLPATAATGQAALAEW